jgi:hypothetical protein
MARARRCSHAPIWTRFPSKSAQAYRTHRHGPDLATPLAKRLAVDTHMSLLADGDFVNQQEAIDAALLQHGAG